MDLSEANRIQFTEKQGSSSTSLQEALEICFSQETFSELARDQQEQYVASIMKEVTMHHLQSYLDLKFLTVESQINSLDTQFLHAHLSFPLCSSCFLEE